MVPLTLAELDPDFTCCIALLVALDLSVKHCAVDHLESLLDLFLQVWVHLCVILLIQG